MTRPGASVGLFPTLGPVTFRVEGPPVPHQIEVHQRGPHGGIGVADESQSFQARVGYAAWMAFRKAGRHQLDCPVEVQLVAVFPRIAALQRQYEGRHYHAVKPDLDKVQRNVGDGLMRSMTGQPRQKGGPPVGVLVEDGRICRWVAEAWYAALNEKPHCVITITELE